jgi:vitamin B12/bleomycin/antimicrobial peptide transport system ATP-binding/permease protein
MTDDEPLAATSAAKPSDGVSEKTALREFFDLTKGFWLGRQRRTAWLLTLGIFAVALAEIGVQIALNRWNGWFFNALEKKDTTIMTTAVTLFAALALVAIALSMAGLLFRMLLQVRWRAWVTEDLLTQWLSENRIVRLLKSSSDATNPEYRIADDVRMATEPVGDFAVGLFGAVLTSLTFIGFLWTLGGSVTLGGFVLPGYMVLCVLVYVAISWVATYWLGRPQVRRATDRNEAEAKFRSELMRLKGEAASRSEAYLNFVEKRQIDGTFGQVVGAWVRLAKQTAAMMSIATANYILAPVIPLLLMAPKYLAGDVTLGTVMQVSLAFVQVQTALNWVVSNYTRLAEWYAAVARVMVLDDAMQELADKPVRQ